jgi:hypothetical protein
MRDPQGSPASDMTMSRGLGLAHALEQGEVQHPLHRIRVEYAKLAEFLWKVTSVFSSEHLLWIRLGL